MFRILNSDQAWPIVLLDLRLVGSSEASTIRLTNAGEVITFYGQTYTPCAFAHGDVQELLATDGGTIPSVGVTITNIDLQMATLLSEHDLNGASAILRVTDRKRISLARDAIVVTQGEVRNPSLDKSVLSFSIVNAIGMTEQIQVPRRIFQKGCNYQYGSTACGATLEQVITSAEAGTTDTVIVLPDAAFAAAGVGDRTEYWAQGYILFIGTDQPCTLQSRPIQKIDGAKVHVTHPFLSTPNVGDELVIRRGCRKTKTDCVDRQGSALNYGGFEGVPYGRVTPTIKD